MRVTVFKVNFPYKKPNMNALPNIIINDLIRQINLDDYLSWRKSDI